MTKIALYTTHKHRFGTKRNFPVVGEVDVDETGCFGEFSQEIADELLSSDIGVSLTPLEAKVVTVIVNTEVEDTKSKEDELAPQTEEAKPLEKGTEKKEEELKPQVEESQPLGEDIVTTPVTEVLEPLVQTEEPVITANGGEITPLEETQPTAVEAKVTEEDAKKELTAMRVVDLQQMAKPFPETEWKTLNKTKLIEYLLNKLK